ncbi:hypothetical protein GS399_09650 [Pedobacter sp. HMF7647]|uniref:Uncharacterized protein n=1 Tax=Hufsiella arboris TaxID=2695275 RepID=A0A7K1Y9I0_9SPHI|nr:hypothetical protein [Hufsiella arboris]MXV51232.1 hypothetical protein [Hufsiella arboris]
MKKILLIAVLIGVAISSCKKDASIPDPNATSDSKDEVNMSSSSTPVIVKTIAGGPYTSGPTLLDGTGKKARFNHPLGINLAANGYLYVADELNNAVRKVSVDGLTTTINSPALQQLKLAEPNGVGLYDDGRLAIVDNGIGGSSRFIVLKSDGSLDYTDDDYHLYSKGLVWNPFDKSFWGGGAFKKPGILKVSPNYSAEKGPVEYSISDTRLDYKIPSDSASFESPFYWTHASFFGYNNVLYLAYSNFDQYSDLYKIVLPNGIQSHIFTDLKFKYVTALVATHDSRSIYIVDDGAIKVIFKGKLKYLTGPNPKYHDSRDGVGTNADVYAFSLALSKDENTLYFTDINANAVRKVILNMH